MSGSSPSWRRSKAMKQTDGLLAPRLLNQRAAKSGLP